MTVEEHLSTFEEVGFIKPREIGPAADLSLMQLIIACDFLTAAVSEY